MIKLFEQWLAESSGEFTVTASTDKGDIDFDGTKQGDLSSNETAAYLVTASRSNLTENGDLVMISQMAKEMGNKSDIVVSRDPSNLTDSVKLVGIVTVRPKKSEENQ